MEVEYLKCKACNNEFHENEADSECVFQETRLEPAEFVLKCPSCGATDDGMNSIIAITYRVVCDICEEVQVQHDGEPCAECHTLAQERLYDDLTGH